MGEIEVFFVNNLKYQEDYIYVIIGEAMNEHMPVCISAVEKYDDIIPAIERNPEFNQQAEVIRVLWVKAYDPRNIPFIKEDQDMLVWVIGDPIFTDVYIEEQKMYKAIWHIEQAIKEEEDTGSNLPFIDNLIVLIGREIDFSINMKELEFSSDW